MFSFLYFQDIDDQCLVSPHMEQFAGMYELPEDPQHLQGLKSKGSSPVTLLGPTPSAYSEDVEFL